MMAVLSWLAWWWLQNPTTEKIMYSSISVFVLYSVFSFLINEIGLRYLGTSKIRYLFRKSVSMLLLVVISAVLLRIWIPNPQALIVAYGVIAAGIAVSLQDIVKNFIGGLTIFFGGLYQVGNRIEINGTAGDVIDIGLFNTTMLEIGEWIDADQATGRITIVPNGAVLKEPTKNYSKQHSYLWDELSIVITSESDWQEAMRLMSEIGLNHTKDFVEEASKSLTRLERYYYVEGHILDPNTYVKPDNNGYKLTLRYVVNAWKRRSTHSDIWSDILITFDDHKLIKIAPVTYSVYEYPKVKGK